MPVKNGEIVMEFDPADQIYALEQAKSELAEAEQEIVKMKADADVQKAQDDVAMLTARFDVRRGELDASGNELIAASRRRRTCCRSRRRSAGSRSSKRTSSRERRPTRRRSPSSRKAQQGDARHAARAAADRQPGLKAPIDGTVSVKENRDGVMFFWGMVIPEYRAGRLGLAGPAGRRRHRVGQDGGAREDRRKRSRQPHCRPARVGRTSTRCRARRSRCKVGALSGLASRAQWFESATRHAALRRNLPVR